MTATAHSTLVELAEEALDYRDYLDDGESPTRRQEREIVAEARRVVEANAASTYWTAPAVTVGNEPPPRLYTEAEVRKAGGKWCEVAHGPTHNVAYTIRRNWIAKGFEATTKVVPGRHYLVLARIAA